MQKEYMLKKNKEFRYVYNKGTSVADRYLVLISVKNRMGMRVGFSVSKKLGNAVCRNHVKRLLRECARSLLTKNHQHKSYLFIARSAAVNASYQTLYKSMEELVAKSCHREQQ